MKSSTGSPSSATPPSIPKSASATTSRPAQILVDDQPGPFLFNLVGVFVVSPTVTGYTPTPSESEWPGQFSSLMTIDKTGLDGAS